MSDLGYCGCGCGIYGALRRKPWANGLKCVQRMCMCKRCVGKRSRLRGKISERAGRAQLGIVPIGPIPTGQEQFDSTPWENKGGAGDTGAMFTAWERVEKRYNETMIPTAGPLLFFRAAHPRRKHALVIIHGDRLHEAWLTLGRNKGWL